MWVSPDTDSLIRNEPIETRNTDICHRSREPGQTYDGPTAVDGVYFTVEKGEIFWILGPNGARRTTTVDAIAGLCRPDSGQISVLGLDPQKDAVELKDSTMPHETNC